MASDSSPGVVFAVRNSHRQVPIDYDTAARAEGYAQAGWKVRWVDIPVGICHVWPALDGFGPDTPVVGGGLAMTYSIHGPLARLGVQPHRTQMDPYPEPLRHLLGRRVWQAEVWDLLEQSKSGPVFIKSSPLKEWPSSILAGSPGDAMGLLHAGDCLAWASEVVHFVAEWRVFVLEGNVIHVAGYRGDPLPRTPPPELLREAATRIERRGWSFDIGLTDDGRYLLVETHNALCLGQYGLGPGWGKLLHHAAWLDAMDLRDA